MEDDKERLTFIRNESAENAQNVSWVVFHTTHTKSSPPCADFLFLQHYFLCKENHLNLP